MKKILLGTSAIALAGATAGQAQAASWDLDWGGYYETSVAYIDHASSNNDLSGIDVVQDSEINFTPSITLDNGITFGVDIQLETNSQAESDIIDESYVFVSGSFGTIQIGSENRPSYKMSYGAPDVTWIGVNSGSLTGIVGVSGGGTAFQDLGVGNDANGINYYTPRFAGFQVGVGYAHDGSESKNARAGGNLRDIFSIGANYVNSFGLFDVVLSGGYVTGTRDIAAVTTTTPGTPAVAEQLGLGVRNTGTSQVLTSAGQQATFAANGVNNVVVIPYVAPVAGIAPVTTTTPAREDSPTKWALAANLGYAGFTVGGSYSHSDNDTGSTGETDFFDVGVSYETGPWGASLTYSDTDNGGLSDTTQIIGGVNYKLGPGVTAGAYAGWAEEDPNGGTSIDGFVIGTGFKLSF